MRFSYAGGSFLTGDDIARAVLDLGAALGRSEMAERIEIPGVTEEGEVQKFAVLIGPASQILTEPVPSDRELEDEEFVQSIKEHTARVLGIATGRVELVESPPAPRATDFDDL